MSGLTLTLFGAFHAEVAGQSLAFPTHKVRALLVYLAVHPGPHWRDSLATLLWGEFPDEDARRNVARSLYRLREGLAPLLADHPDILEADRHTIQFHLDSAHHHVDVLRFEQLLHLCHTHEHEALSACALCIPQLEEAVSLYRGPFLEGFTLPDSPGFSEWQTLRQESYLEQAIGALSTLTEHALLLGELTQAQQLAQQQLALIPWREEAHRQMMRILLRAGQRSAALAQYAKCRQLLAEELGAEPERETTALHERIKRGAASHNLPAPTTPLIGQESTLTQIISRLRDPGCRLLTLVGLGGIGKTKLALAAAWRAVGAFRDGVYLISLAGLEGSEEQASDLLREATLSTLQAAQVLPQELGSLPDVAIVAALRDKNFLLVLDNFESVAGSTATLVKWLARAPDLSLLVTSRERLNLQAETIFPIPPLAVPLEEEPLPTLDGYSAVQLFVQSARRVYAPFHLDSSNSRAVAQICHLVGGLPLALEMAATWTPLMTCEQIAAQIAAQLDFLSTSQLDVPERQRSVRAVLQQSWQLLNEEEQRLLASLSVFAGSFSAEAAQAVSASEGAGRFWAPLMNSLLGKMLVRRTPTNRFELHPLVRSYAAEKLAERGEQRGVQSRHSACYAALVAGHVPSGKQEHAHVRVIKAEIENIRVGWAWAVESRQFPLIEQFLEGLFNFYEYQSWYEEAAFVLGEALHHLFGESNILKVGEDTHTRELQAWLLIYLGICHSNLKPSEEARVTLERGLALAISLEHQEATARGLLAMGILIVSSSLLEADLYLEQALALYQKLQDEDGIARCLFLLGASAAKQGNYPRAKQFHEQNLVICRRISSTRGIIFELCNLGLIHRALGNYGRAQHHYQEALTLARSINSDEAESSVLACLIDVAGIGEGYEYARRYFEEFLACEGGHRDVHLGSAHLNLGSAALIHGRYEEALGQLEQALAVFRRVEHLQGISTTLPWLGEAAAALGKREVAWDHFTEALAVGLKTGSFCNLLTTLIGCARLLACEGHPLRAIELLALVLHHPATWYEDRQRASQLLAEITATLASDLVAAATTRGQVAALDSVVTTLLTDMGHAVPSHFVTGYDAPS